MRRASRWTLALFAACGVSAIGSPVGSSTTVIREVIDDRGAGDCSAFGDLDGDGRADLVNGGGLAGGTAVDLRVYAGLTAGATPTTSVVHRPEPGTALVGGCVVADLDGDGDGDIAALSTVRGAGGLATGPTTIVWFERPPTAGAPWVRHDAGEVAGVALDLVAADLDGDGRVDLAARSDGALALRYGGGSSGAGTWTTVDLGAAAGAGRGLLAADVDGDGDVDLLAGGTLLANGGGRSWTAAALADASSATAAAGDVDGDGAVEIVLGPFDRPGGLIVLERPAGGGGPWAATPVGTSTTLPLHRLLLVDLDADGSLDLVSSATFGPLEVRAGLGGGRFAAPTTLDPDGWFEVAAADVDGDGTVDLGGSDGAGRAPVVLLRNVGVTPPAAGPPPAPIDVSGDPTPAPTTTAATPTPGTDVPAPAPADAATPPGAGTAPEASTTDPAVEATTSTGLTALTGTRPTTPAASSSTTAELDRGPGGATAPVLAGPPSVDPEVRVLPERIERITTLDTGRVALALALFGGLVAATGLTVARRRTAAAAGADAASADATVTPGARAAGAPAAGPDRAVPTAADPTS